MDNFHQKLRDLNRSIVDVEISIERTEAAIFRRKRVNPKLETDSFERVLEKLLASLQRLHEYRATLKHSMLVIATPRQTSESQLSIEPKDRQDPEGHD